MAEHGSGALVIRQAQRADVEAIVSLLAQDGVVGTRELCVQPLPQVYYEAFEEITRNTDNTLVVAEIEGEVVGTLQLTLIPYLTMQGGKRALVEAVFVNEQYRGLGIGRKLMQWAIDSARAANCSMVQLTTNKQRAAAHRFYESLGFVGSHTGMKLVLEQGEHC
jgi:GNAT superfamily N-acetyltransferase